MTPDDFLNEFLDAIEQNVYYWGTAKLDPDSDNLRYRLAGLAFSILNTVDDYWLIPTLEDGSVKKRLNLSGELHSTFIRTRCKDWDRYIESARKAGAI